MLAKEIWDKLSAIDVGEHIEKKGNLSYLSWAWAWAEFMKHYPDAKYEMDDVTVYADGTVEVSCLVSVIRGDESVVRPMSLPVMTFPRGKPPCSITNPTSMDINTSRMRCMVKCLALFGLGHYIYAGEDLPDDGEDRPKTKTQQAPQQDNDDKPWFNEEDFEKMRDKFEASIKAGDRTGSEIVKNLRNTFKVNKRFAADIEGLG